MDQPSKSIEQISSKDDSACSVISDMEEDPSLRPFLTFRERLQKLFHSHKFQVGIVALVILDCLLVITELMLEIKIHEINNPAPHVLHYMSIAILSIFIVEILFKIFAFRLEFFHHKLEVFDAFVVFLSFALDIAYPEQEGTGFDLIIILRLWRVARILNGVVMSVKTQSEHKLLKERKLREGLEQELSKSRVYTVALEQEVATLRSLLQKFDIKEVPPSIVDPKTFSQNTISVIAEVNQIH